MNTKSELKQLKLLIKLQERDTLPWLFKPIFIPIIWLIIGVIISTSKRAYEASHLHPYVFVALIISLGVAIGFYAVFKQSYKAWPVIKPYVDTDKIRSRVRELEKT